MMFSDQSASLLAHRMRFLGNPELLADAFEFCQPEGFNAVEWADAALVLEEDLKAGKAITLNDRNIALLVESLEGNSVIGRSVPSRRKGLIQLAEVVAKRLEPLIGRPVVPEVD
jgi:hypothetical protein